MMVFLFEGPLFALIFAQSLRGMGRHTKTASVFITSAVSGGSVFAPVASHIASSDGKPKYALVVAVAVFATGTVYPLWLNLSPLARRQVDPIEDLTRGADTRPAPGPPSASKVLDAMRFRKKREPELANVEWNERTNNDR